MHRYFLVLFLLCSWTKATCFAQDCSKHDNYLRARIFLVDSVALEYISMDGVIKPMYKFKIDTVFYGEYDCRFIYVVLDGDGNIIYQFNPLKNTGKEYWWGLSKIGDMHENIPIYRQSSCF